MRKKWTLALGMTVVISVVAVIAFFTVGLSNAGETGPEAAAVTGPESGKSAPAMVTDSTYGEELPVARLKADQPSGSDEGIQVHGRWTIEITEPDGRLVSLTEFDNSLADPWGGPILANVLAHVWSPGAWKITLTGLGSAQPCDTMASSGAPRPCEIYELPLTDNIVANPLFPHTFGDLSVTAPTSGPNADALVLSGTATVAFDSTIAEVATAVRGCAPSVAPADANCGGSFLTFTSKTLSNGVAVLGGQAVNVTVVISFS